MNIIKNTVRNRMAAVERFSVTIRAQMGSVTHITYLTARRSTPSGFCKEAKMKATAVTTTPLANSEGWKRKPKSRGIQRAPSFTLPMAKAATRRMILIGMPKIPTNLK